MIAQILLIIGFVIYITFSCINFMEPPGDATEQWRRERNWKVSIAIGLFILLYLAGTFKGLIP